MKTFTGEKRVEDAMFKKNAVRYLTFLILLTAAPIFAHQTECDKAQLCREVVCGDACITQQDKYYFAICMGS